MTRLDLRSLKIVLVGEGVGKTSILDTFIAGKLNLKELPRVYDNHVEMLVDPHQPVGYLLKLWDTSAHPGFDRLRPLTYSNVTVFMVLFSIDDRESLESMPTRWFKEIHTFDEAIPFHLVGTKIDLRTNHSIQTEEGEEMAHILGAANLSIRADHKIQQEIKDMLVGLEGAFQTC